jgi:cytosine/adenosine deaminase-related metal-dependent hydrolase
VLISDQCSGRRTAFASPWLRAPGALVLRNVTVIDGTGAAPRPGMAVVIQGPIIRNIVPDSSLVIPANADVRDLAGRWVMPGLIDAHVHLATNPSTQDTRDRVERRLRNALEGGVIAVRDMAGDGRELAALARDAAVGDIASPLIRYSALFAGPDFFSDPRVQSSSAGVVAGTAPWARAIRDTTDLRQAVAEARGTGAAGIKLYGSLDSASVARIAAEARRQRLGVWAHLALFPARPSDVVTGGAGVVSHAPLLAWEVAETLPGVSQRQQYDVTLTADHPALRAVLNAMRERNVILEPTLHVFRDDPGLPDTATERRRSRLAAEFTRAAYRAGVRIAAGTDGIGGEGPNTLPNIHEELALLVAAGLTPADAIVAATSTNAEVLGISATHGTLAAGKSADLLVLGADPTVSIRNTRTIEMVVQRGRTVDSRQ